jgi:eukaryotic-like serine/threonine-protein kinase
MAQAIDSPGVAAADPDSACVAEFERALRARSDANPRDFLPSATAADYLPTLVELVRVDIERRWARGIPRSVESYLAEYPELLVIDARAALAFEDYRGRVRRSQPESPIALLSESGSRLLVTMRQSVRPLTALRVTDSSTVENWEEEIATLPRVGENFLGFHLKELLGRGAFGRVYLAGQGDLGDRLVALKVGAELFSESQTLAQLQHTNIVPIYSLHRWRRLHAVCMPYFGRTTLAHVLAGIRGQAVFPSSGHALLSTLHLHATPTTPDRCGSSHDGSVAAPSVTVEPDPTAKALLCRLSYPDAVVWVGSQLAAGLAHAHERGIIHRDLKPANVLITDDGIPMILDFNLAEDTKIRGRVEGAAVGGTLPYMSPEQLEAFDNPSRAIDGRSDIYSLGVVLFELLTGRRPFVDRHSRPLTAVVQAMRAARNAGAPSPRAFNPAVSFGVDAIIRKCLAPDPAARYASARDLQEDLDRHLSHRPLKHVRVRSWRERARKWTARHPRLSSSSSVATVALILLSILSVSAVYARERNRTYRASEAFREHTGEFRDLQVFLDDRNRSLPALDEGLARCRTALARYGVPDDGTDDWEKAQAVRYLNDSDRQTLREDIGEVYYLMARVAYRRGATTDDPAEQSALTAEAGEWNARAEKYAGGRIPRALLEQRADLARIAGDQDAEREIRSRARATEPVAARDHYLMGYWSANLRRYREALVHLQKATQLEPEHFPAWFVRGTCHLALEQNEMAALCFGSCLALNKDSAPAWLNRGLAYNRMFFFKEACADYDRALALNPRLVEALLQRADAKEGLGDVKGAVADLTAALETGAAPTRVYFFRARLRDRLGDRPAAEADRAAGLNTRPGDERSWVARAEHRLDDPKAALADVNEAFRLNPDSMDALQLKAHILSERLARGTAAIQLLNRAVEFYPDYVPFRAGRGVLLARAGKRSEALRDAEDSIQLNIKGPNLYQVACIYALTSRQEPSDRAKALELLRSGLRTGFGLDLVDTDTDLDPIRKDPAFDRIVAESRALQSRR